MGELAVPFITCQSGAHYGRPAAVTVLYHNCAQVYMCMECYEDFMPKVESYAKFLCRRCNSVFLDRSLFMRILPL